MVHERSEIRRMRPAQTSGAPTPRLDLEGRLVDRARAGDVQAWSRLYQEHFDGIFRHILHLTGDRDVAEDLVQETFAKAMVSLPRFRGDSKLSTWLSGIAINIVRGHWRRQKSARKAHDGLVALNEVAPPKGAAPDQAGLQRARAEALYGVLNELPETLREVFVLREIEGMRAAEVASQLGISEGNVNTRASRARARVRRELERLGWLKPKAASPAKGSKGRRQ